MVWWCGKDVINELQLKWKQSQADPWEIALQPAMLDKKVLRCDETKASIARILFISIPSPQKTSRGKITLSVITVEFPTTIGLTVL